MSFSLKQRIACQLLLLCAMAALARAQEAVKQAESRGLALEKKGDAQGALAAWRKATKLDPKSALIEEHIGFLLAVLKRHEAAIPHFIKALELNPTFAPAHYHLGVAYWLQQDPNRSIPQLQAAADSVPDNF